MIIAGVNTGLTRDGLHNLKDGAACILQDGKFLIAVAEERVSRQKHAGGFERSLQYCISSAGLKLSDLDMLVVSSCAEEPLEDGCDIGVSIDRAKVRAMPSHHLSHAYTAFMTSPFEESVIMILDNEGSLLGSTRKPIYADDRVERNSYYLGTGDRIERLELADDGLNDSEIGPGEAYRHFTYFLGWHSYVLAGNTMGLAPYGRKDAYESLSVFDLHSGTIRSLLLNGGADPSAAVTRLANAKKLPIGPPRSLQEAITPRHADIAAVIQGELERALIYKAAALYRSTGVKNLCLGGGVALNCVAARKILDCTPFERVYVGPAPGDSGQCLGNALYGWTRLAGRPRRRGMLSPFLGRTYSDAELLAAVSSEGGRLSCIRSSSIAEDAAGLLAEGNVVGWFQGRSELGPRALGARSILADPRQSAMRDFLNVIVKHREPFRPYAPSVLETEAGRYFDLPQPTPYMELTATVEAAVRGAVPAIVHVDGSCRPQTIMSNDSSSFGVLVREFYRQTGIPMVLNTSFNLSGEPIVESPMDAIGCFMRSRLDVLVMGDYLIRRSPSGSSGSLFWKWASGAVSDTD
jgi:carbamoyltransferase